MDQEAETKSPDTARELATWQKNALPFLIIIVSVALAFFLIATAIQLFRLQERAHDFPKLDLGTNSLVQSEVLSKLEAHSVQCRFHFGGVLLTARLWVVYLGFLTGMTIAIIGAAFILGKLQTEQQSEMSGNAGGNSVTFKSASPGLIMVGLGTVLMMATILSPQTISVREGPLYLGISSTLKPPVQKDFDAKDLEALKLLSETPRQTNAVGQ
jgi:hypothetical protein